MEYEFDEFDKYDQILFEHDIDVYVTMLEENTTDYSAVELSIRNAKRAGIL